MPRGCRHQLLTNYCLYSSSQAAHKGPALIMLHYQAFFAQRAGFEGGKKLPTLTCMLWIGLAFYLPADCLYTPVRAVVTKA